MGISKKTLSLSKNLVLAVGILLLGLAVACSSSSSDDAGGGSPSKLIPQKASIIGTVATDQQLDAINMDQFFEMFSSGLPGDEKGFNKFFSIDQLKDGGLFGAVSQVDIFGDISDTDDLEYFGALLHGSFDESKLIAELEDVSGRKLTKKDYKGTNVYSPEDDPDEYDLSILNGSKFAVGTGGAINDVIDIIKGDVQPASGALVDTFNGLAGGLFGLAFNLPKDASEGLLGDAGSSGLPGLGDLPISMDFLSSLNVVGVGGNINGSNLDVVSTLDFTDAEAAESLEGFISGLVSLASGFITDPKAAGLLGGLEIEREVSLLTLKVSIPTADLPDLLGDMTSADSAENSPSNNLTPGTPEIRLLPSAVGIEIPILGADHVNEGVRVEYNSTPPTSGEHWPQWADCGFYSEDLPDERIVHNLEHGNIVVSYNFANPAQVTELREALEDVPLFANWGIARPYDGIPDGRVALAAWGRLDITQGVNPERIGVFFESLAGILGPERVTC
ncbi:MAG: DUF3105 domain-containing protein [Chloroflexi bacterium]|nr:DUF3105 domain-containing protein [Chloroflexota bacterium]